MKQVTFFAFVGVTVLTVAVVGCNTSKSELPPSSTAGQQNAIDSSETADPGNAGSQTDMEKMKMELAKLSAEDASSVEKQHLCPVSGEMLGTMGTPLKVDVNDQQLWICCEGCRESILNNPDEYLTKLNQN